MIVDEFITLLSFDADLSEGKAYQGLLSQIEQHAGEISVGITAAAGAVQYFAQETAESLAHNVRWADSIGASTDSIQRFGHAAFLVGGNVDDLRADIEKMAPRAAMTGQSLEDLFGQVADTAGAMDKQMSYSFLSSLGYSNTMIRVLQQGREGMKKAMDQTIVVSPENLHAALELSNIWKRLGTMIREVAESGIAEALPEFHELVESTKDFIEENKELIKSGVAAFFMSIAKGIRAAFVPLADIVRIMAPFLSFLNKITGGLIPATAGTLALSAALTVLAYSGIKNAVLGLGWLGRGLLLLLMDTNKNIGRLSLLAYEIKEIGLAQAFANTELATAITKWWALVGAQTAALGRGTAITAMLIKEALPTKVLAVANLLMAGSFSAAAAASWALTASLLANPITWIVLGVVALIASLVLVIKYWKEISGFFKWMKYGNSELAITAKMVTQILSPLSLIYFYWEDIANAISKATGKSSGFIGSISPMLALIKALRDIFLAIEIIVTRVMDRITKSTKALAEWVAKLDWLKGGIKELMQFEGGGKSTSSPTMPNNTVTAGPQATYNSARHQNVTNNVTINAGAATSPGAIAQYMKNTNIMQALGYGQVGGIA